MSYKIVLSCTSGVSSEVIAGKMRAAAEVASKNFVIEEKPANEKDLGSLAGVDALLLSPQLGHMEAELKAKYPNTIVKVIDMRDYSVMDGEAILEKIEADIKEAAQPKNKIPKHIVLICTEGFSSAGIAKKIKEAAKAIDGSLDLEVESLGAIASELQKIPNIDLVLLAPGVVYMKDEFASAIPSGTPILEIDGVDYGTANGEAIIKKALEALK